jgi:hypothetical protein
MVADVTRARKSVRILLSYVVVPHSTLGSNERRRCELAHISGCKLLRSVAHSKPGDVENYLRLPGQRSGFLQADKQTNSEPFVTSQKCDKSNACRRQRQLLLFRPTYNLVCPYWLVAPHDIYGLLFAATPRNRYGLRGAAWHIWPVGRCDSRRISMCPIPGNIICICVADIA